MGSSHKRPIIHITATLTCTQDLDYGGGTLQNQEDTTTENWGGVGSTYQRHAFHAYGRYWRFWSDGTRMVFATSTNGKIWTSPIAVRECIADYQFSIAFDGVYVHYCYSVTGLGDGLFYTRGLLNVSGTITWDHDQQVCSVQPDHAIFDPHIVVDSNGYPWIAYGYGQRSAEGWNGQCYVRKSSARNGKWANEFNELITNTIFRQADYGVPPCWAALAPMTNGKMYA